MATTDTVTSGDEVDRDGLVAWLADVVDPSITSVEVTKLAGGHSSGAWRLDVAGGATRTLVLKAPQAESIVFRRDAAREGRILDELHRAGAPVPALVAIDADGRALGRPAFAMELVPGRSPEDAGLGGYHEDPWFIAAGPAAQRAAWESFYDALAALHSADGRQVPDAALGSAGLVDVVAYWREALLDVASVEAVPRQLAVLDWLLANLPLGADDDPVVCMGDARLVNCLFEGSEARALVDFEVAYLGNPKADVGYSCFMDGLQRQNTATPLPGVGTTDEAWTHWAAATGRDIRDQHYWTAFGAMVLTITATRAMVQWGLDGPDLEASNPIISAWESAVHAAA